MKQYIVDAFTDRPFSGNPAAVCVMDSWPSEESMMKLAMENNLSETVRRMEPDQLLLAKLEGRVQNATARGKDTDCVSRSFCPKVSVPEDPVCGSAHCQIADFWSRELGKKDIVAYQASRRGGYLYCEMQGNGRIRLSGKAVLVAVSELAAELP